jgi:hypothetical protein
VEMQDPIHWEEASPNSGSQSSDHMILCSNSSDYTSDAGSYRYMAPGIVIVAMGSVSGAGLAIAAESSLHPCCRAGIQEGGDQVQRVPYTTLASWITCFISNSVLW